MLVFSACKTLRKRKAGVLRGGEKGRVRLNSYPPMRRGVGGGCGMV